MDPQSRRLDMAIGHVEIPFIWIWLWCIFRVRFKRKATDKWLWLETEKAEKTLLEYDISKFVVSLVQHTYTHKDDQDHSSADKYCVYERWDVIVGELKNALTEVAAITLANATHREMEGALPLEEFLKERGADGDCEAATQTVGHSVSCYFFDCDGMIFREAQIDGGRQKDVLIALHARILYSSHYPTSAGPTRETRMYHTMRQHFYWLHMANVVYKPGRKFRSCTQNWSRVTHKQKLQLFLAAGPLEFVAIDILGPLPRTKTGNQHVFIIKDQLSKLTRAIHTAKINSMQIVTIFWTIWSCHMG